MLCVVGRSKHALSGFVLGAYSMLNLKYRIQYHGATPHKHSFMGFGQLCDRVYPLEGTVPSKRTSHKIVLLLLLGISKLIFCCALSSGGYTEIQCCLFKEMGFHSSYWLLWEGKASWFKIGRKVKDKWLLCLYISMLLALFHFSRVKVLQSSSIWTLIWLVTSVE